MVKLKVLAKVLAAAIFLILLSSIPDPVSSKGMYVQPLNMGMQMAIPYDIANIFNRPIAGVTSVVLTVGLAIVLIFGVITSPFGYMFGIPSNKYVMGKMPEKPVTIRRSFTPEPESEFNAFLNSIFFLLPEESNPSCRAHIICFAHGTLKHLPTKALSLYKYFRYDTFLIQYLHARILICFIQ